MTRINDVSAVMITAKAVPVYTAVRADAVVLQVSHEMPIKVFDDWNLAKLDSMLLSKLDDNLFRKPFGGIL